MGISEMFIIILVYGGIFTYIWQMILANTKTNFLCKVGITNYFIWLFFYYYLVHLQRARRSY